MSDTIEAPQAVDAASLRRFLDGEYREIRERVRERMADEQYAPVPGDIDRDEYRELVMKWMKALADEGEATILFPEKYGGRGNPGGGGPPVVRLRPPPPPPPLRGGRRPSPVRAR